MIGILIPSLPQLQAHFGLTPFGIQLTLSSLLMGVLGNRLCRRRVILGSIIIFNSGSLLCVFGPSFMSILAGHVLQGIGIAGGSTLVFVAITDEFPEDKQPKFL